MDVVVFVDERDVFLAGESFIIPNNRRCIYRLFCCYGSDHPFLLLS